MMLRPDTSILVTGASGQVGGYLLRELRELGCDVTAWSGGSRGELLGAPLRPVDLADEQQIERALREIEPRVIVHAAAISTPAGVFKDLERARRINVDATEQLACHAASIGARFVFLSTDMVFSGEASMAKEADEPAPASRYGRTKLEAEQRIAEYRGAVTLRMSLMYGPSLHGKPTLLDQQIAAMRRGEKVKLFLDEWRTPLDLPTAAKAIIAAAASDLTGVYHVGGPERLSRLDMGRQLAAVLGAGDDVIDAVTRLSFPSPEPRPADCSLDSSRFWARFPEIAPRPFRAAAAAMV